MLIEKRFDVSILGGFKKESVLSYIEKMAEEHEEDLKALESSYKEKLFSLNELLKKNKLSSDENKKKLSNLEAKLNSREKAIEKIINEKQLIIDEKDEAILHMQDRIKCLEIELYNVKNGDVQDDGRVKKAEYIARERVSKIIKIGKAKILEEYKEQIEHCKEEKDLIKKKAIKEAYDILTSAASRIFNYNKYFQEEVKKLSLNVKQKAKDIIETAKSLGEKILKDSYKLACEKSTDVNLEKFKIPENFEGEYLNNKVDEDVSKAIEKLKNLDLFLKKDIDFYSKNFFNKKKVFLDVVSKKNK